MCGVKKFDEQMVVVGAGLGALGFACGLRNEQQVLILEKSRGVGGRAATRRVGGFRFDHGANYFSSDDAEVRQLILEELPGGRPLEISGGIWTFGEEGKLSPGDPTRDLGEKWTYSEGINRLAAELVELSACEVRRQTRVAALRRGGGRWQVWGDEGQLLGVADEVVVNCPPPQLADLLDVGDGSKGMSNGECVGHGLSNGLVRELRQPNYLMQWVVMLGFAGRLDLPEGMCAALNTDRRHCVAWLGVEDAKPGRVERGKSALVVQFSPAWTEVNFELERGEVERFGLEQVSQFFPNLPELEVRSSQRWKFAAPTRKISGEIWQDLESLGIYYVGDGHLEKGRVCGALKTGLELAKRLGKRTIS